MFAKVFGLSVAVFAAAVLMSASSAAVATVQSGAAIDLSTRSAVVKYLESIHIDPRGLVIQRGLRNYAGPDCPGKGWTCASTAHPVVQVARLGGVNTYACSTAQCSVTQSSATNTARCIQTDYVKKMTCTITQSAGNNLAVVYQSIGASLNLNKVNPKATITQTTDDSPNGNTACVTQNVNLTRSGRATPFTATLNAHQTVTISQTATGTGANSAEFGATPTGDTAECNTLDSPSPPLQQNQTLVSVAHSSGAIHQNENVSSTGGANVTIDIAQNSDSGTNNANFAQTNTLSANASNGGNAGVFQVEGQGDNDMDGDTSDDDTDDDIPSVVLGTINQGSSGKSKATATQTLNQCEAANSPTHCSTKGKKCTTDDNGVLHCTTPPPAASRIEKPFAQKHSGGLGLQFPLKQVQTGAVRKGVGTSTQTGNPDDAFTVNQLSTQTDTTNTGQTAVINGDCQTSGSCAVTQINDVNGTSGTKTGGPGQSVNVTTTSSTGPATYLPVTVLQLNPVGVGGGACQEGFASGTGLGGVPQELHENVDLSQFDGRPIELRFSFSTGDAQFNDFEGWYVKNIDVTGTGGPVFSDAVADGDTNFTAANDFGSAPGWHVSHQRDATFGGPAWWYGNEATGSYQSPGFTNACQDTATNKGTITTAPFTLGVNSQLSFDTLWQIEGANPSSFDQMDVVVVPVFP